MKKEEVDILKDEKTKEQARRIEAKEKEVAYHAQFKKPLKEEIIERRIFSASGEKVKTIKRTTYNNGIVKERLMRVDKELGGGKKKQIF